MALWSPTVRTVPLRAPSRTHASVARSRSAIDLGAALSEEHARRIYVSTREMVAPQLCDYTIRSMLADVTRTPKTWNLFLAVSLAVGLGATCDAARRRWHITSHLRFSSGSSDVPRYASDYTHAHTT